MYIAATAVSMDAARIYKEVEQRFTGLSVGMAAAATAHQADPFGRRLATMLAGTTQTTLTCRSEVSRADGAGCPGRAGWDTPSTTGLARLVGEVIGQPVSMRGFEIGLDPELPFVPPAPAATPLLGVQTAHLFSGEVYREEESLLFSARGTVRTGDGREIAFDLGLSMRRSTVAVTASALAVSPLFIDPLILQFDLDSPLLGDGSFCFDLDSDGDEESLACPGSGCGFLAFDRNRDGRINNGLELFGPASGSGFGELADLDQDANLWIDASDPAFDQLLIWSPDGQGGVTLRSLREAGVGAIAVLHAGTDFQLERADGSTMGTLKASGLFLTEDGEVRPLQEVNLALPAGRSASEATNPKQLHRRMEAALHALREIIALQRLRLRMLLTGERLRRTMVAREEPQQFLFNGLHARNPWQVRIDGRPGESRESGAGEFHASPSRQHGPPASEETG